MRATIVSGLLASLLTLASAQVREVWRYVYTPPQDDLAAHLERAVRLSDGGLMLLGWVETPLNGRDALAIRLLPSGAEAWVYQVDGAGFDDAFVDAVESANELRLLGQFTDADGYLAAQVHRLTPAGQPSGVFTLSRTPNSHLRPLRFSDYDQSNANVVAEVVQGGVSQTLFYNASISGYHLFVPFSFRPWGVLSGDVAVDYPSAILGTVATANNSVDAIFSTLNYGLHRYSGAPRGVDIPAVGAVRRLAERVDYYIGIQSEGGMFGEDAVLIRYHILGAVVWGYRYTNQWHDDYAEDLAVDAQGNASLLVKSVLWRGEPYERRTLRLVRFSENGRLLSDAELVEDGRPFLSGLVRVNETGQRYVAVSGAVHPDAPQGVSLLARVDASGQFLWRLPSDIEYDALFAESDGSLLTAGSLVFEGQGFPTPYYRRVVAVRYAPNGDLDGNGCVDDADLLQVLFAFGQQGADLAADLNGDALVDDADLLQVLFAFGEGC
jgi:hypothetical protein